MGSSGSGSVVYKAGRCVQRTLTWPREGQLTGEAIPQAWAASWFDPESGCDVAGRMCDGP